jgi:hypothetical protein
VRNIPTQQTALEPNEVIKLVTPSRLGKWLGVPTGEINLKRLLIAIIA